MKKIILTERHVRSGRIVIEWSDLQKLVREAALAAAGVEDGPGVTVKLTVEDDKDGTGWRSGTKIYADVSVDLLAAPTAPQ